jgi:hypothetical protein
MIHYGFHTAAGDLCISVPKTAIASDPTPSRNGDSIKGQHVTQDAFIGLNETSRHDCQYTCTRIIEVV